LQENAASTKNRTAFVRNQREESKQGCISDLYLSTIKLSFNSTGKR